MIKRIKLAVAGLLLALGLGGAALVFAPTPAFAHSTLGVAHTHLGGCSNNNCYIWILANGAIQVGPSANLTASYGYVLVVCSYHSGGFWHISNLGQWGPYGNDGAWYPYCVNPADANGLRWNMQPGGYT